MADETPHIHGTPIVDEPQSVRELFNWAYAKFNALEARLAAVEKPKAAVEKPKVQ